MVFGTTLGLELGLTLLCYREGLRCDLCVWYYGGTGIGLIAVVV